MTEVRNLAPSEVMVYRPASQMLKAYVLPEIERRIGSGTIEESSLPLQVYLGDAFSIATSPCSKWMNWRYCSQNHNSHATKSCGTSQGQPDWLKTDSEGFADLLGVHEPLSTRDVIRLLPRPVKSADEDPGDAELTYPRRILAVDVGEFSKDPERE